MPATLPSRNPGAHLHLTIPDGATVDTVTDSPTYRLTDSPAPARSPQRPLLIHDGLVKLYRRTWWDKRRGKTYPSVMLIWRDHAGRHREKRATLPAAKKRAEHIVTRILNGQASMLALRPSDQAAYTRALELLAPTGKTLELAVSEYAEAMKILGPACSLSDAARFYMEHRPAEAEPKDIAGLVAEIIQRKRQKKNGRWVDSLEQQLDLFAGHFHGPVHLLRAHELSAWLDGLKVGERTRRNYRDAIRTLIRFAQDHRYLARDWDELRHVEEPEIRPGQVVTLTPDQLTRLLAVAPENLVPFIAITAFAGVRHEEMTSHKKHRLDWRDIDLEAQTLYIQKDVAKTGADRLVPLPPNLVAWLKRYAQPNGPVCRLANSSNALARAKRKAGISTGRNETRNSLRKTFISARLAITKNAAQVAEEAGTSTAKIRTNYKRPLPEPEAKRWFGIYPTHADIVQLPLAFK